MTQSGCYVWHIWILTCNFILLFFALIYMLTSLHIHLQQGIQLFYFQQIHLQQGNFKLSEQSLEVGLSYNFEVSDCCIYLLSMVK